MSRFIRFSRNIIGRDFVVGDIHGCFPLLEQLLAKVRFDPEQDRLFSVGDMVDRGPESARALEFLAKPWFHAILGNHEQMVIDAVAEMLDNDLYFYSGGAWFFGLSKSEQQEFAVAFRELPVAIELESVHGLIGLVHAECPLSDWKDFTSRLQDESDPLRYIEAQAIWGRTRISSGRTDTVDNIAFVFCGHTVLCKPAQLGNHLFIDTGAVFGGRLTMVNLTNFHYAQVAREGSE
ncbi:serine/threonine protein phosphatase [Pseudomonas cavernicola]|uniref:Serine/threonine protein phosphatase n=1 Tax=Pseudomonas cavernicola TaxID=2320866 RepID=A0A418XEY7_9PSED|nr:metallophosphoesterase [Pseudomonas cavernicola]RJG11096.1 serine/threonine protein phosphatase [Pseudomonas cavernicola]